jgi:hypothetical protein
MRVGQARITQEITMDEAQTSAEDIPGILNVQCKCGWHGTTEYLEDKTCPICGEAFESYPTSGVALGLPHNLWSSAGK